MEKNKGQERQSKRPLLGVLAIAGLTFVLSGKASEVAGAITAGSSANAPVVATANVLPQLVAIESTPVTQAPEQSQARVQLSPQKLAIINSLNLRPDQKEYLKELIPVVMKGYLEKGYKYSPPDVVAQGVLETGHGENDPYFEEFGVKASKNWKGQSFNAPTFEVINGKTVHIHDTFQGYPSMEAAVDGYALFVGTNPNYRDAVANYQNPEAYLNGLENDGKGHQYATAPDYVEKINSVIRDDRLIELTS
jgi:flagellum-specific peptidoglycan hydrolase FlgJ